MPCPRCCNCTNRMNLLWHARNVSAVSPCSVKQRHQQPLGPCDQRFPPASANAQQQSVRATHTSNPRAFRTTPEGTRRQWPAKDASPEPEPLLGIRRHPRPRNLQPIWTASSDRAARGASARSGSSLPLRAVLARRLTAFLQSCEWYSPVFGL